MHDAALASALAAAVVGLPGGDTSDTISTAFFFVATAHAVVLTSEESDDGFVGVCVSVGELSAFMVPK